MPIVRSFLFILLFTFLIFNLTSISNAQSAKAVANPIEVGEDAPDFDLQGIGMRVKLSDFLAKGNNVVVVFSRAHW